MLRLAITSRKELPGGLDTTLLIQYGDPDGGWSLLCSGPPMSPPLPTNYPKINAA